MLKDKILFVNGIKISLTGLNKSGRIQGLALEVKEEIAKKVISTATSSSKNTFILFDGCKDTLVVLHLVRQVCNQKMCFPVLHIDTSVKFKEIYQYMDKMSMLWRFDLVTERNEEALRTLKIAKDPAHCCKLLKADALARAVKKFNIDYLITGARYETQKTEVFISESGEHVRLNPLLFHTDRDISGYIKRWNLPYCSLYDNGYRYIDCKPCTRPVEDIKASPQDEAKIKKGLEALGYLG